MPEKLDRLIEYLEMRDGDRLVDVGSGNGWLLRRIAERRKVDAVGLELSSVFAAESRRRLAEASLVGSVGIVEGPALQYAAAGAGFDIALCIGATFALGDLDGTAAWMARIVRRGGRIAIGEPFARLPFPPHVREREPQYDRTLAELVDAIAAHGFAPTGVIASSDDDWDHYESQRWRAGVAWLNENPGHAEADAFRRQVDEGRNRYLGEERDVFGWAIVVAERVGS
ncbi:MAG TPA: class I SAM-dependent methyltransferase [Caulobacteraceae bacterium]|nr:class I SAM-dependent methyltransferase [Caulobacteraceae bacterium]